MENKENENEIKEIQEEKDLLKIPLTLYEEKYLFKIYPSMDNINIVFKLEKDKVQTYYYFEKFDLRDFRQINKSFLSDTNVREVFTHLKDMAKKCVIYLEKKEMKMDITFNNKLEIRPNIKFFLRKKIVTQDRLNPILVEQIQDNKSKINMLKKQIIKLNDSLNTKNDVIDSINNNITNINNIINNINANSVNNSNSTKNSSSNEDNSENASMNNYSSNNNDEEDDDNIKGNSNLLNMETKRNGNKNRKKNKNSYKKNKYPYDNNNTNNNDNNAFCFQSMEIFQNKKVIELLIILNIVTILIVLYILGSIYNLKNSLDYDKIRDDDLMNKMAYLSFVDESNDEEYINYRDLFRENMDLQLKKKEEQRITRAQPNEEYIDDRKKKIQERRKRNNKI